MPTFGPSGHDEYICQKCARIFDSGTHPSEWRPDITGSQSAGNVCPACVRKHGQPHSLTAECVAAGTDWPPPNVPMSLHDYCRQESGLDGPALDRYINRYYGHG